MEQYLMALDQGTTSSRCILFNKQGQVVSLAQKEFRQIYPAPGFVEHDPMEIWSTQIGVAQEAMYKIGAGYRQIAAIGITNQRETTILWERSTGRPIYNAIVWQCRRTAEYCDFLREQGALGFVRERTGLTIDAYFSATKIRWILDHVPGAQKMAEKGDLAFGTVDSWLIWNLTKGRVHKTDYTNAARTMLFDIKKLQFDPELLKLMNIPAPILPAVYPSCHLFGKTDPTIFGGPIPIGGAAGDQQSALFGQTCFMPGMAKNTYGTGCFLLMNTGEKPVVSKNGLLTTIAWGSKEGHVSYALEGSVFVAGAAIQWLRDEMKLIESAPDSEYMANKVQDTNGVYVVPAFTGIGAPYWDAYARGAIFGLTRGANKYHIIRATLESLAYQVYDVLFSMQEDSGISLAALKVDGGACANNFLMQFQVDMIKAPIHRPVCIETTALGAAYFAGLAVGFYKDQEEILKNWRLEREFIPKMEEKLRQEKLAGWQDAVRRTFSRGKDKQN